MNWGKYYLNTGVLLWIAMMILSVINPPIAGIIAFTILGMILAAIVFCVYMADKES